MIVDMVYDIFRKHNPMLACIADGYGTLERTALNGINHDSNEHYRGLYSGIPLYRPVHGSCKEQAKPKDFHKALSLKREGITVSIPHSVYRGHTHIAKIGKRKYSSIFQ